MFGKRWFGKKISGSARHPQAANICSCEVNDIWICRRSKAAGEDRYGIARICRRPAESLACCGVWAAPTTRIWWSVGLSKAPFPGADRRAIRRSSSQPASNAVKVHARWRQWWHRPQEACCAIHRDDDATPASDSAAFDCTARQTVSTGQVREPAHQDLITARGWGSPSQVLTHNCMAETMRLRLRLGTGTVV